MIFSVKFGKKVTYCNSLNDLQEHIDVKSLPIPEKIKQYVEKINKLSKLTKFLQLKDMNQLFVK